MSNAAWIGFGADLGVVEYEPIPADIAQKLGIEPKEN